MTHELILSACLHHNSNASNQISSLHAHRCSLVVEPPLNGTSNLLQVRLATLTKGVDNSTETIEHNLVLPRVGSCDVRVDRLFLECVQNAINEPFLEALVDITCSKVRQDLLNRFHNHTTIWFRVVLQIIDNSDNDVGTANLIRELFGRLNHLLVVATIQSHSANPEILEEFWQDFLANVFWLHSCSSDTLLNYLQHNSLHFLVRRVELAK
mmetsp:Transcript_14825/g.24525  ORF Transcript_14825/g.24525 Transcript_14825/m.24525 type:complete len:211 (-) Transcript_14825:291-923(-)